MDVKIITTTEEFEEIRGDWDAIYAVDPHATIFMSWSWIRGWIEGETRKWAVIGVRPDSASPFAAFMTLVISHVPSWVRYRLAVLHMGGHPLSDHTGFVCLPSVFDKAVAMFARVVDRHFGRWATFYVRDVMDPRAETFLAALRSDAYTAHRLPATPVPFMQLPQTWEEYLREYRSRHPSHHHIARKLRKIERYSDIRVTQAGQGDFHSHCETFLRIHQIRFGQKDEERLRRLRVLFRWCLEGGSLWLAVMWLGDRPMATLAALIDKQKRRFATYLCGFDPEFAKFSPGQVLFAYSIRYAIRESFQEYDFLRGPEDYKYMFGAVDRFNANAFIKPKGLMRAIEGVDRRITRGIEHLKHATTGRALFG